ncbi:hypothetical protein C8R46DRAFT_1216113 [Mycena filopes]|nr:hypothetical protein C8R46DRAFT_1216113 [Mycena filopes]
MSATGSERATRTRAGPSKPVSKKRKQTKEVEEQEESDDFTAAAPDSVVDDDDDVMEVEPPPPTRKPASRAAPKSAAKGKGKAKADTAATRKQPSREDVDAEDDDDTGPGGTAHAINNATSSNRATKQTGRADNSARQIERLKRQLDAANVHIKDLSTQLEESYRVRHTEPEELFRRQEERYEEQLRAKDLLIKQQEEMLHQREPLAREGKTSVLHMVTREHADAEKRSSEEQVTYWKDQVDKTKKLLEGKEEEIVHLKQLHSDLRYELKTERENAQKSRNPPSASRPRGPNGLLGSDDPKHSELVQFYEDVTNLLVTDIKIQEPKYFTLDEWSLTCIYTYADKTGSAASRRSLAFLLRFTYDPFDTSTVVESVEDLDKAAQYTPLNLDQESPEFTEALQFLNTGFTFPRTQLPLFFSSLVENMKAACDGNEPSEPASDQEQDDESMDVQIVE